MTRTVRVTDDITTNTRTEELTMRVNVTCDYKAGGQS
jgi:hypothetical protein